MLLSAHGTLLVSQSELGNLLFANLAQLVHHGRIASHHTLGHLGQSAGNVLVRDGIVSCSHLDADDADSGVIGRAIVDAIAQIANPGLQMRLVVLLYELPISDDFGGSTDGSPFARVVEEANVDVCVGGEVVGLA